MGIQNATAILETRVAVSYEIKCIFTIQLSDSLPRYLSKRNERCMSICMCAHILMNSIVPNCPKQETTQMPIDR